MVRSKKIYKKIGAIQNRDADPNKCSREVAEIRDKFADYFMTEGAVPWQWEITKIKRILNI